MTFSTSGATAVINAMTLSKLANGEYSASSVATDPIDANRLSLTRLKDGNYASLLFASLGTIATPPAYNSSTGIQAALTNLVLGG